MKTFYLIIIPLCLTILFMFFLWHMSTSVLLERFGQKETGGIFKISPSLDFRYSEYGIVGVLIAYNVFAAFLISDRPSLKARKKK